MKAGQRVFVDTGVWIALAITGDPLHSQALPVWTEGNARGVRWVTSVPVVMETFTFLDRNASREAAVRWKDSLPSVDRLQTLECRKSDLEAAWSYFVRRDLHKLSAVDATSFALMAREQIRSAFAFDHHFAIAGFTLLG